MWQMPLPLFQLGKGAPRQSKFQEFSLVCIAFFTLDGPVA